MGASVSNLPLMPAIFSPDGGTYPPENFPITVTITIQAPATHFRYTINDSNIDENTGTLVNAMSTTVVVESRDVLRAVAIDALNRPSLQTYAEYDHVGGGGGGGHPPIIP